MGTLETRCGNCGAAYALYHRCTPELFQPTVCIRDPQTGQWRCQGPVAHWPAQNSEAQVGAMQRLGPNPDATGGFVAYAEWLALINPPAPERDPRD